MRVEVKAFMRSHQDWLENIFRSGRESGEFQFKEMPARLARTFFSSLQGTLLVKRPTGEIGQVKDVQRVIRHLMR